MKSIVCTDTTLLSSYRHTVSHDLRIKNNIVFVKQLDYSLKKCLSQYFSSTFLTEKVRICPLLIIFKYKLHSYRKAGRFRLSMTRGKSNTISFSGFPVRNLGGFPLDIDS